MHHIVMGLKFLHDHGILHRSLSATCIGIDEDHEIKLRNWGRATFIETVPETENSEVGDKKMFFLAPGIISGECDFNPNLDIWSLGILAL